MCCRLYLARGGEIEPVNKGASSKAQLLARLKMEEERGERLEEEVNIRTGSSKTLFCPHTGAAPAGLRWKFAPSSSGKNLHLRRNDGCGPGANP